MFISQNVQNKSKVKIVMNIYTPQSGLKGVIRGREGGMGVVARVEKI